MNPADSDELRHEPGSHPDWQEAWSFELTTPTGVALCAQLTWWPAAGLAWWWTALVAPDIVGPVLVRDLDVPPPRTPALEIRADGLWAELVCETPHEHWGIGLEAFGVRLDDPADAFTGERGERLPVGLDLEWEATTPLLEPPAARSAAPTESSGYAQAGAVHGEALLGRGSIPVDGSGLRVHEWGVAQWWSRPRHRLACLIDADELVLTVDHTGAGAALRWLAPYERVVSHAVQASHRVGADGLPAASRVTVDHDLEIDVEIEGLAPLLIEAPDGRRSRFTRACCRFDVRDGIGDREGHGWADWLEPTAPAGA